MQRTDAELIRRSREADGDAFAELVRRYEKRVFGIVYRMLNDHTEATDITQETFIKAYTHLDQFDDERPLMPWLATIALNLARNLLTSAWAKRQALDDNLSCSPSEFTRLEVLDEVQSVLSHLTPEQREVIVLRHISDLTYEEIAGVTGEKISTVKSRLFEARQRIKLLRTHEEAKL